MEGSKCMSDKLIDPQAAVDYMIAKSAEYAQAKANRIYIGSDAKLMGYLSRLAPDFAANLIYKNMKSLLG